MVEVKLISQDGDRINDLVKTAIDIVKIPNVSYAMFHFNDIKLFILKDSTEESVLNDYRSGFQDADQQGKEEAK